MIFGVLQIRSILLLRVIFQEFSMFGPGDLHNRESHHSNHGQPEGDVAICLDIDKAHRHITEYGNGRNGLYTTAGGKMLVEQRHCGKEFVNVWYVWCLHEVGEGFKSSRRKDGIDSC